MSVDEQSMSDLRENNSPPSRSPETIQRTLLVVIIHVAAKRLHPAVLHLRLSVRTVENHAARIRKKLRVGNRAALVRFALESRPIDL